MEEKTKKRKTWALVLAIILITGGMFLLIRGISGEDSWIQDSRGVYIKHGNPSSTPNYVLQQQEVINCASEKFNNLTEERNSQCLGTCEGYAVDMVHSPRAKEDDLIGNQCEDYLNGNVSHFIELNKEKGEIVRIV